MIGIALFNCISVLNVHGPSNSRRCRTPSVPGAGIEEDLPVECGSPSVFDARAVRRINGRLRDDHRTVPGHLELHQLFNWPFVRVVSAVL